MTADVAVRDTSAPLALRPGQMIFDDLQTKALVAIGVKNATKADLAVFAHVCHRMRLDPFTRQIYMIERREKVGDRWVSKQTIQTGIDGFRVTRDRVAKETGCEVEFEDTVWFDAEGKEHKVWLSDTPPTACRVVLLKHSNTTGRTLRYPAVLRTAAYVQKKDGKPTGQWRNEKQPDHMIEKCCEAFATRRAFPNDFSGVYLEEEMQAHTGDEAEQAAGRKITAADIMQPQAPADGDVAVGELVDEPEPSDQGEKHEPAPKPATVRTVNDQFSRLGFTVRDADEVNKTIATLAGRGLPVNGAKDLDAEELQAVHDLLSTCDSRDDLVAMLVQIAESKGSTEPDSEDAGE